MFMKKILSIVLSAVMLLSLTAGMNISAYADDAQGSCGENVTYALDNATGTLTLSGTGGMFDYGWNNSPFNGSAQVKKLVVENGVTSIGDNFMRNCPNLASIEIADSVTSIGTGVFRNCSSLKEFTLPVGVTSLGNYVFMNSNNITSFSVEAGNNVYDSREDCNAIIETASNKLLFGCANTVIPDSITGIAVYAFFGFEGITKVNIKAGVTFIGEDAFGECPNISEIKVDSANTVYDSREGCNAIIESATNTLIAGCKNTVIPNGVLHIGRCAFDGNDVPDGFTLPDGLLSIDDFAFFDCGNLSAISFPASVNSIGYGIFSSCSNLKTVEVSEKNAVYDSRDNCNAIIETATNKLIAGCAGSYVPRGVAVIEEAAFDSCVGLESILIPATVTRIASGAFFDCAGLNDVYYEGSEEEWRQITDDGDNDFLYNANIHYNEYWCLYSDAYINGVKVDPSKPIKLEKGSKLFICFDTDVRNTEHGYAPLVGFADNYPGGMLSSAGFKVTEGNASVFGFDYTKWGFGSDPYGSLIEAGDLASGTIGKLDYFLYKCENFDWANFDFVNTPRTYIKTLTFVVEDHKWNSGTVVKTTATTYTKKYTCSVCNATYTKTFNKKANTLTVKGKSPVLKYKLLRKKNQTVLRKNAVTVSKAVGSVTYAKAKGDKKISVAKNGKITVKKGIKKGKYKVVIKVKAAGSTYYKALTKKVTVTVVVK